MKRIFDKRSWIFDRENISVLHYVGIKPWDILDFDPKYESLNQIWLNTLNKEDLLTLFRFSKIYASRRSLKFNETLKNREREIKALKLTISKQNTKPKQKEKNKSYIRNFLINIWNKLP